MRPHSKAYAAPATTRRAAARGTTPNAPTRDRDGGGHPRRTQDFANHQREREHQPQDEVTVPAYLILHPTGQHRDDILIEDDDLKLHICEGWAILSDTKGICYAVPSGQGASIQRVDQDNADGADEAGEAHHPQDG
ncbi:hypothetical protein [Streptomyces acidiscabies]|uniref:hypothetical protein n=1 Tax=Streptomyces acidiscabies TaxID=42234 RepID=UPI002116B69E|nr:hypothetical protein [Streptomyces acidiscabies]